MECLPSKAPPSKARLLNALANTRHDRHWIPACAGMTTTQPRDTLRTPSPLRGEGWGEGPAGAMRQKPLNPPH